MSESISSWLSGRLPEEWFEAAPEVTADRDEILVVGRIAAGESAGDGEAEQRFGRKVAWGAECGGTRAVFTSLSVPVMTRLRQPERRVLDTLVDAGVARSRSHALAWCVRLVGQHSDDWLTALRAAMEDVERVREQGPAA